ncbi:MAG: hypothetical protein ACP5NV_05070, partial [Candidatus Woesearchaeota archaeon]
TNIKYSSSSGSFASKTSLNGFIQPITLTIPKTTSILPVVNSTYWQVLPDPLFEIYERVCEGKIIFSAEAS